MNQGLPWDQTSVCFTCNFLDMYTNVLDGVGVNLFDKLTPFVGGILALMMVLVLIYKIQVEQFLNSISMGPRAEGLFDDLFRNIGALIVGALLLGSSVFWRDYVVGTINFAIATVATEVINAIDFEGAAAVDPNAGLPSDPIGNVFGAPAQKTETDLFQSMMQSMYENSYQPLDEIMGAFSATDFKLSNLTSLPAALMFSLTMWAAYLFAALANIGFFLILAMHKTMTVLITGLGPIIIMLWVFRASRHYAISLVRFLAATGSIVIGAAFLVGMSLAIVQNSIEKSNMVVIVDGKTMIDLIAMSKWLFTPQYAAFFAGYIVLFVMVLISVLLGIVTMMAQRPQLDK